MAVEPRPKLTYEDYVLFPDDGRRRELIDGEVHVTPSPNVRHQRIALYLASAMKDHLEKHGGGEAFIAPLDVLLSEVDVVQPDVVFVAEADSEVVTKDNIKGVPTLLVEVVSDPAVDRRLKRDLYARYGVPEYWVVDPDADRVEVHRLSGSGYGKPEIFEPGDTLSTEHLGGLQLDLAELFRR